MMHTFQTITDIFRLKKLRTIATPQTAGTKCELRCSARHYVDVTPFLATSRFSTGCFL